MKIYSDTFVTRVTDKLRGKWYSLIVDLIDDQVHFSNYVRSNDRDSSEVSKNFDFVKSS